jgi:hypothetical protein
MSTYLDIATIEQLNAEELIAAINHLISTDFEKLVFLLYRIDVSEKKIKALLDNASSSNAGELIAQAIIERLEEKKASREKYKQAGEIPEDEKW